MFVCIMVFDNMFVNDFVANVWLETNKMNIASHDIGEDFSYRSFLKNIMFFR